MAFGRTNAGGGENVTAEVNVQTPLIAEIESTLAGKSGVTGQIKQVTPTAEGVTVTPDPGHLLSSVYVKPVVTEGQYAWRKSEIVSVAGTISITQNNSGSSPTIMQVTSNDVDLSLLTKESFIGLTGTVIINGNNRTYSFEIYNGKHCIKTGTTGSWTYDEYDYDPSTHKISIPKTYGSIFKWSDLTIGTTVHDNPVYVIANESTKYPNGAESNGYWYEMIS